MMRRPPFVDGINKASTGISAETPGLVKLGLGGKTASHGPIGQADFPLEWAPVVDVPNATTGQCGDTNFAVGNCILAGGGQHGQVSDQVAA